MSTYTVGLDELSLVVNAIVEKIPSGVVILRGDLASGKTTLVQEIVKKLGIFDDVTSPTFSLQQCYGEKVYHYDMYSHGIEHFISLGMLEELEKEGYHFVEWGDDKLYTILINAGMEVMCVEIEKSSDDTREYRIEYA